MDTEGGMNNKPLWDAALVVDAHGQKPYAVRYCMFSTEYHKNKLSKSLPAHIFNTMQPEVTCKIEYTEENHKWQHSKYENIDKSIGDCMSVHLCKDAYILAWNMKGHDAKILQKHLPKAQIETLALQDPLIWFRKHYSLPYNTLSSNKKGTPRAVMEAGDYSYLGPEHSAFVDTLHMRDVTYNAAVKLQQRKQPNSNTNDIQHVLKTQFIHNTDTKDPACEPASTNEWMWEDKWWDKDTQKLHKPTSKQFKRSLKEWLRKNGYEINEADNNRINAIMKRATLRRYLNDTWAIVEIGRAHV